MVEQLKEACGVFGAYNFRDEPVFPYVYWGLRGQNHRGHQSHGFLTFNGQFHVHKGLDLVPEIKRGTIQKWTRRLPGQVGLGHVRYTTSGKTDGRSLVKSTQPILEREGTNTLALSFNGNVVNVPALTREIKKRFWRNWLKPLLAINHPWIKRLWSRSY